MHKRCLSRDPHPRTVTRINKLLSSVIFCLPSGNRDVSPPLFSLILQTLGLTNNWNGKTPFLVSGTVTRTLTVDPTTETGDFGLLVPTTSYSSRREVDGVRDLFSVFLWVYVVYVLTRLPDLRKSTIKQDKGFLIDNSSSFPVPLPFIMIHFQRLLWRTFPQPSLKENLHFYEEVNITPIQTYVGRIQLLYRSVFK